MWLKNSDATVISTRALSLGCDPLRLWVTLHRIIGEVYWCAGIQLEPRKSRAINVCSLWLKWTSWARSVSHLPPNCLPSQSSNPCHTTKSGVRQMGKLSFHCDFAVSLEEGSRCCACCSWRGLGHMWPGPWPGWFADFSEPSLISRMNKKSNYRI